MDGDQDSGGKFAFFLEIIVISLKEPELEKIRLSPSPVNICLPRQTFYMQILPKNYLKFKFV